MDGKGEGGRGGERRQGGHHNSIHVFYKQPVVVFQQIFRPPLDLFDVIIHLEPRQLCRRYHAVDLRPGVPIPSHQGGDKGRRELPVVNYDPVQCYLQELRVCRNKRL